MQSKQIDSNSSNDGKVFWSVTCTERDSILIENHIFDPVQSILNLLMVAN